MGQPQYLCLDTPQSFNLKLIFFVPNFSFSRYSIVLIIETSGHFNPFKKDELKRYPGPVKALFFISKYRINKSIHEDNLQDLGYETGKVEL